MCQFLAAPLFTSKRMMSIKESCRVCFKHCKLPLGNNWPNFQLLRVWNMDTEKSTAKPWKVKVGESFIIPVSQKSMSDILGQKHEDGCSSAIEEFLVIIQTTNCLLFLLFWKLLSWTFWSLRKYLFLLRSLMGLKTSYSLAFKSKLLGCKKLFYVCSVSYERNWFRYRTLNSQR